MVKREQVRVLHIPHSLLALVAWILYKAHGFTTLVHPGEVSEVIHIPVLTCKAPLDEWRKYTIMFFPKKRNKQNYKNGCGFTNL